jgi:hypothetical protein
VPDKPSQQINEPTEIVVSEMCPAGANQHRRIFRNEISPMPRKTGELTGIIVEEDPVLAPCLPAFD